MEQFLSMVGPFLCRVTNWNRALSEKQLLQIGLNWLGTGGQYHSGCDRNNVSTASVHTLVLISDVTLWGYVSRQYRCRWLCLLLIYSCLINLTTVVTVQTFWRFVLSKTSRMRRSISLYFTSLPPPLSLIFVLSLFAWHLILHYVSCTHLWLVQYASLLHSHVCIPMNSNLFASSKTGFFL